MGNPTYRERLETRRAARKRDDATLVVEAFEKFIQAMIEDEMNKGVESNLRLSQVRLGLIDFLCQQATR